MPLLPADKATDLVGSLFGVRGGVEFVVQSFPWGSSVSIVPTGKRRLASDLTWVTTASRGWKRGQARERKPKKLWVLVVEKHRDPWGLLQTEWDSVSCQIYQLKMLAFVFHCKETCRQDLISKL